MLKEIPWDVINVWGGEEANNFYYLNTANNNNRPNNNVVDNIVNIYKNNGNSVRVYNNPNNFNNDQIPKFEIQCP